MDHQISGEGVGTKKNHAVQNTKKNIMQKCNHKKTIPRIGQKTNHAAPLKLLIKVNHTQKTTHSPPRKSDGAPLIFKGGHLNFQGGHLQYHTF